MKLRNIPIMVMSVAIFSFAQINFRGTDITFRDYDNAGNMTYHYGNLLLDGGSSGNSWGWLLCNAINANAYDQYSTFNGGMQIFGSAFIYNDLYVYGNKNFLQLHPTDNTKAIKYSCIESGEALTIVRGTATTSNGIAEITLPEHFALVTSDSAPLTVLLTPEKVPVLLYAKEKSKQKIIVAMKKSDFKELGDATFAWQVTGVRDGFENPKVIVDLDKSGNVINDAPVSTKRAKMNERIAKIREAQKATAPKAPTAPHK